MLNHGKRQIVKTLKDGVKMKIEVNEFLPGRFYLSVNGIVIGEHIYGKDEKYKHPERWAKTQLKKRNEVIDRNIRRLKREIDELQEEKRILNGEIKVKEIKNTEDEDKYIFQGEQVSINFNRDTGGRQYAIEYLNESILGEGFLIAAFPTMDMALNFINDNGLIFKEENFHDAKN